MRELEWSTKILVAEVHYNECWDWCTNRLNINDWYQSLGPGSGIDTYFHFRYKADGILFKLGAPT